MSLFKQPQGIFAQIQVSKARKSCSRTVVKNKSVKKYSFANLQPHKCLYCPLRFCCSFLLSLRQERPHILALIIFLIWFVISAVYLSLQLRPAIPSDIAGLSPMFCYVVAGPLVLRSEIVGTISRQQRILLLCRTIVFILLFLKHNRLIQYTTLERLFNLINGVVVTNCSKERIRKRAVRQAQSKRWIQQVICGTLSEEPQQDLKSYLQLSDDNFCDLLGLVESLITKQYTCMQEVRMRELTVVDQPVFINCV